MRVCAGNGSYGNLSGRAQVDRGGEGGQCMDRAEGPRKLAFQRQPEQRPGDRRGGCLERGSLRVGVEGEKGVGPRAGAGGVRGQVHGRR